jgi:hypothetical protein
MDVPLAFDACCVRDETIAFGRFLQERCGIVANRFVRSCSCIDSIRFNRSVDVERESFRFVWFGSGEPRAFRPIERMRVNILVDATREMDFCVDIRLRMTPCGGVRRIKLTS